ncbi:glycolate oxidase-like protein [Psychromonas ingrahamii 37]|uniref:Glycolate oxidase-like protein n=1 Tax=Psychromonas ingrahamii (strain DSM 17664 / CCUG 51855 / 37) TaxID=357804 RepID=A1SVG6_PSYIN|nr:(Fe-S)-binding protein [Psychromonas ingrahamii]ABM03481.1 glycolate oxidase-like protein [Psychromonas ingrahamii 37]
MSQKISNAGRTPSNTIECLNISEKKVGLFVTCLVNTMRPSIGFASITLLEQAGCTVEVPELQSCCGQPAFNSGDDEGTRQIAYQTIKQFENFDYVVLPSGSCAAMIKKNFIEVFKDQPEWLARAKHLADITHELLSFLVDVCQFEPNGIELDGSYTYHDSCSGYRALHVYEQPRKMLSTVKGLEHKPLNNHSECCGFGGTFCVKYSDISNEIVGEKVENVLATEADYLLGGDMGCLMNIAGKLNREGHKEITALHTAEVLAGLAPQILGGKDAS